MEEAASSATFDGLEQTVRRMETTQSTHETDLRGLQQSFRRMLESVGELKKKSLPVDAKELSKNPQYQAIEKGLEESFNDLGKLIEENEVMLDRYEQIYQRQKSQLEGLPPALVESHMVTIQHS